jgi:hypothetical protein
MARLAFSIDCMPIRLEMWRVGSGFVSLALSCRFLDTMRRDYKNKTLRIRSRNC